MSDNEVASTPAGEPVDRSEAVVRPPLLVLAALLVGFGVDFVRPMSLFGASLAAVERGVIGGVLFAASLALAAWAMVSFSRAGTNVPTTLPTTAIVGAGPYGFTRNPIYVGMLGLILAVAIAADSVWILSMLPI